MKTKHLIKLSKIVDKLEIKNELTSIKGESNEEIAEKLLALIITNLYKAEQEIYEFIAVYKGITVEEAENEDIIKLLTDIFDIKGMKDFLSSTRD